MGTSKTFLESSRIELSLSINNSNTIFWVYCSFNNDNISIVGLYFDERKDKTSQQCGNKRTTVVEEHMSLVYEPNSQYIGHLTPENDSSKCINSSIREFIKEKRLT